MPDPTVLAADANAGAGAAAGAAAGAGGGGAAQDAFEAYQAAHTAFVAEPTKAELKTAADAALDKLKTTYAEQKTGLAAVKAPDTYALELPENSPLKPEYLASVGAFAKANNLTLKQAQAILEREHVGEVERSKTFDLVKQGWLEETKADPEIGGDKLAAAAEGAKRVLARFDGDKKLIADLESTGLGNHPALIKFLFNISKAMSDDQLVVGSGRSDAAEPQSHAAALFPKSLAAAQGQAAA